VNANDKVTYAEICDQYAMHYDAKVHNCISISINELRYELACDRLSLACDMTL